MIWYLLLKKDWHQNIDFFKILNTKFSYTRRNVANIDIK